MAETAQMSQADVVALMESCRSAQDWSRNAAKVRAAFNDDYPPFWWNAIMASGLAERVNARWKGEGKLRVDVLISGDLNNGVWQRIH